MEDAEFTTKRCYIRELILDDAPALLRLMQDEEVRKYVSYAEQTSLKDAERLIKFWQAQNENLMDETFEKKDFGVYLKEEDTLIGTISFNANSTALKIVDRTIELSGAVATYCHAYRKKYWTKGYASEVCLGAIGYWFGLRSSHLAIIADYAIENIGSRKAMENAGMKFVGERYSVDGLDLVTGEAVNCGMMQITRSEWTRRF